MKIFTIQGSPRKKGGTQQIIDSFHAGATEAGHSHETIHVYEMDLNGCIACMACTEGTVDVCVQDDDFTPLFERIVAADVLVFGTPVYFGQMTGPLKTFLDRLYTFCLEGFEIRELKGKKYVTVVTSGAQEEMFCKPVTEYFNTWLGDFFHMESSGSLICGDLMKDTDIIGHQEVLTEARKIGKNL